MAAHGESGVFDIVSTAHAPATSLGAFLDRVTEVAAPVVAAELGVIATVTRRGEQAMTLEAYAEHANPFTWLRPTFTEACRSTPASTFEPYYGPGETVRTLAEIRARLPRNGPDVGARFVEMGGLEDFLLLVGHPAHDVVLAIAALERRRRIHKPRLRRQLVQMMLHLENAARLHLDVRRELAVIAPDGRIVHAEAACRVRDTRDLLATHVRGIEQARLGAHRGAVDDALDAWPALVDGTYSLVEQIDRDGKRAYRAFANPPATRGSRALTDRERCVLELSARGFSGKWVAYALGLSMSSVSEALSSAARKLGVASRTRVVSAVAPLVSAAPARARAQALTATLTEAEREIWELVREGLGNEAIAARRGRSVRTIANQVSGLLRKLDVTGRRALAALPDDEASRSAPRESQRVRKEVPEQRVHGAPEQAGPRDVHDEPRTRDAERRGGHAAARG